MKRFIKKNAFIALTLILVLSLVFPAIKSSAASKDSDKYEVKVTYGIDGKFRAMKYVPVNVTIKSLEKDFNGEVEIRTNANTPGTYDAYSTKVSIAAGEEAQVVIPAKISEMDNKFTVNLIEDGKVILEKKNLVSAGRVSEGSLLTGILTDDATSLGYLGYISYTDPNNKVTNNLNPVKLDINSIAFSTLNIDALNIIVINNFNMGNLKEEHYNNLNAWINKGGTLIIGSGVNEGKTVKSLDKALIDVKSKGIANKNVKLVNENLNLDISKLEIKDSKILLGTKDEVFAYEVSRGSGRIVVTTIDLGTEPLISSKEDTELFSKIVLKDFEAMSNYYMNGGGNRYSYMADNLLRTVPINKIIGVNSLGIVLGIYALLVGVVLYIVLKKMKKRDLIWVAVPVLAVGFSLIIYLMGNSTRVNDLIVNQVNIIDVNKEGKGEVKGYVGIGTKYKDDVNIEKPKDVVMNFMDNNNYYGMPEEKPATKLRVKTTYSDGNSYFDFENSNALEMKGFQVTGKEQILPKIESKFNFNGGNLNGKVKNNLDADINKLILISGENIWDLGIIKKGEELNIQEAKLSKSSGLEVFGGELSNMFYDAKYQKSGDLKSPEFKNITRYGNMLQMLAGEVHLKDESKLIAITDMGIDYGIKFSTKDISKYDSTIIVQDAEIDFKDEQGNINFPRGYFKGVVENNGGNVHVEETSGMIYGDGEIIFNFDINKEIEILKVELSKAESPYGYKQGNVNTSPGEYLVYNYKTSSYDKIDLGSSTSITLSNTENYTVDNRIKVKVVIVNGNDAAIPKATIKGRVK